MNDTGETRREAGESRRGSVWGPWSYRHEPRLMASAAKAFQAALARGLSEERAAQEAADAIVAALPGVIDEDSTSLVVQLRHSAPRTLSRHRRMRRWFESRLDAVWGDALDELCMLLLCCQELGVDFNEAHRPPVLNEQGVRVNALVNVHARACLVASEIHALLRTGHALGAHARWRTLHELAVVAEILAKGDDELSERFLIHGAAEAYEDALAHEQHRERTGRDPYDPEELDRLREIYETAKAQYGPKFSKAWRWAEAVTAPDIPNFRRLEEIAELDLARPDFRTASHLLHGGSSGADFVRAEFRGEQVLLSGPVNHGLAAPGHGAAISLVQVTTSTVLSGDTSVVNPLLFSELRVLRALADSCGKAFYGAASELDRLEAEYQKAEGRGLLGTLVNRWRLDAYRVRRRSTILTRWVRAHLRRQ